MKLLYAYDFSVMNFGSCGVSTGSYSYILFKVRDVDKIKIYFRVRMHAKVRKMLKIRVKVRMGLGQEMKLGLKLGWG